jgi:hypothetical protein
MTRDAAVRSLGGMIAETVKQAKERDLRLVPIIAIGCPGLIEKDGTIARGAQNLPGKWEGKAFHLPSAVREEVPRIGGHETMVVMHNDAVVQGLSELPNLAEVNRWGIVTIGTGLGNARLSRKKEKR